MILREREREIYDTTSSSPRPHQALEHAWFAPDADSELRAVALDGSLAAMKRWNAKRKLKARHVTRRVMPF
jgi:hypothetical protein